MTYYIDILIISIILFLYDVLGIRLAIFVPYTVNIQLIALSHKSENSDYRKELKYIYYDETTSINYYTSSHDLELIEKVDNLIFLIFQQLLQSFIQLLLISDFETLFKR